MNKEFISDPNCSIWVNASAGTGKTKILIDRVLALLLKKVNINKILCLTFTNIAAQEMKERIYSQITQWQIFSDSELYNSVKNSLYRDPTIEELNNAKNIFQELINPLNELKIKTIHSFCNDVISKFPFEMGLSPNIELLDEIFSKKILRQIKYDLLINDDIKLNNSVSQILSKISEGKFNEIIEYVILHQEKLSVILANFDNIDVIIEQIKLYFNYPLDFDYQKYLEEFCLNQTELLNKLSIYWSIESPTKTDLARKNIIINWRKKNLKEKIISFDELLNCFLTKNGEIIKSFLSVKLINILEDENQIFEKIIENSHDLHKYSLDHNLLHDSENFLIIAKYVIDSYNKYKNLNNKLDYDDMIKKVMLLLKSENNASSALYKLDYQIEHILLDEAQDTNYSQWSIIDSLSTEFFSGFGANIAARSIFIVGDVKQSIFSFQGADPEILINMKNYFRKKIENSQFYFKEITLDQSYRSTNTILNIVDKIFNQPFLAEKLFITEKLFHNPIRDDYEGIVTLLPLVKYIKSDPFICDQWLMPTKFISKHNSDKILAEFIANMIAAWLKKGKILASENRLLEEKDIMILVKKRTEFIDYFSEFCQMLNIKNSGKDILYLNEQIIIQDLLSFAKFVLLPEDDLNLACLLKSPLLNFSEEELYELCYERKTSLWENLSANLAKKEKYKITYKILYEYLSKADFYTPFEFFYEIIEVKNLKEKYHKIYGNIAENILKQFLNQAQKFEKENIISLQLFIQWFEEYDYLLKRNLQIEDGIRIMTIHGSKGLEAPIVILVDTTDITESNDLLLWMDDLLPIWPIKKRNLNVKSQEIEESFKEKQISEYYRLLYVAMTRARDELIISGKEKSSKISEFSWYKIIEKSLLEEGEVEKISQIANFDIEKFCNDKLIRKGAKDLFTYPISDNY